MSTTSFLLLVTFMSMVVNLNAFHIKHEDDYEEELYFGNSLESSRGERSKRGDLFVPNIEDFAEFESKKLLFLEVEVLIDQKLKKTKEDVRKALQEVNAIFTHKKFMPKIHIVVREIVTQPLNIPTNIIEAEKKIAGYAKVNSSVDLTFVYTVGQSDWPGETNEQLIDWKMKNQKGKLCSRKVALIYDLKASQADLHSKMAHEIGWLFGMEMDNCGSGCGCQNLPNMMNCIMSPLEKYRGLREGLPFSSTSMRAWFSFFRYNKLSCLGGGSKPKNGAFTICGNGLIEPTETCDCYGYNYKCRKCCDMTTCQLPAANKCFDEGQCCINCQFGKINQVCRPSKDPDCDPAEVCGAGNSCPKDLFHPKGKACKDKGSCREGLCIPVKPAQENKGKKYLWLIILAAVILGLIVIFLIWYFCCRKDKKAASTSAKSTASTNIPNSQQSSLKSASPQSSAKATSQQQSSRPVSSARPSSQHSSAKPVSSAKPSSQSKVSSQSSKK